jgi:hypothetical protein
MKTFMTHLQIQLPLVLFRMTYPLLLVLTQLILTTEGLEMKTLRDYLKWTLTKPPLRNKQVINIRKVTLRSVVYPGRWQEGEQLPPRKPHHRRQNRRSRRSGKMHTRTMQVCRSNLFQMTKCVRRDKMPPRKWEVEVEVVEEEEDGVVMSLLLPKRVTLVWNPVQEQDIKNVAKVATWEDTPEL